MKKVLSVLLLSFVLCSFVFAGQVLGTDKNLELEANFAYLLTTGQKAHVSGATTNDTYFVNAIGFKLGAVYDNTDYPLDFYADLAFAFPSKYDLTPSTGKETYYKATVAKQGITDYNYSNTSWSMFKLDAGVLFDIDIFPSTSLMKLKAGCGFGWNSFNQSQTGRDPKNNSSKYSYTKNFKNFGIELKGMITYNFMGNFYINASVTPGFNFLGSYTEKTKAGSYFYGWDNSLQFAFGFNMLASVGITCNI